MDQEMQTLTMEAGRVVEQWIEKTGFSDRYGYIVLLVRTDGQTGTTTNVRQKEAVGHILHDVGAGMLREPEEIIDVPTGRN